MLAYGGSARFLDEYNCLKESTVPHYVKEFVKSVNEPFGKEYLCSPSKDKIKS